MLQKTYLICCLCLALSFSSFLAKAQDSFQPGYAILSNGTRAPGLIMFFAKTPWHNQRYIWMKDSAEVAANPNKEIKAKKYNVDDLKSYKVGEHSYEKVHYLDLEKLQVKNLGTNDHMMEKLTSGKITSYRYYSYPSDMFAGSKASIDEEIRKENNDLLNNWHFLAKKENDEKYRDVFDYDLQKYFEDTPEVLQKYQAGGYGNEPVTQKKGLAAKMMAMAKKATYSRMQYETLVAAIDDYNAKNAGK